MSKSTLPPSPRLRGGPGRPTLMALALCGLAATARAEPPPPVEATLSIGLTGVDGDRADTALAGQYGGLRPGRQVQGLLGLDYLRRRDSDDTLIRLQGTRLLGETRELNLLWQQQGDWRLRARYGEAVRHEPHTLNSALAGAGSTTPQVQAVAPGSGSDIDLSIRRRALGLGFTQWLGRHLQVEVDLQAETREGSRLFGIGLTCPSPALPGCAGGSAATTGWALLLLPEPIHSQTSQVEARLSYAHDGLRLSAGYHGSFFDNHHGALSATVPGSLNNALGTLLPLSTGLQAQLAQPVALPPDNQAHQLDLSGGLDLSRTTQASFKIAYGLAMQNADFTAAGLSGAPAGVANLGARVYTTLAQVGLHARPMPALTLHADLRYDDRVDRTPLAPYYVDGSGLLTNRQLPQTRWRGRLEGSLRFAGQYRATLTADAEAIDRGVFTATSAVSGVSALRQKTDETGVRAELRRTMSETLSGAVSVSRHRRDGSNWLRPNAGAGVTEVADPATGFFATALFMPTLADRQRDKARLFVDWAPTEALSLQFSADEGRDRFQLPTAYGLHRTRLSQLGVDASFAINDDWTLEAHAARASQGLHQSRPAGYVLAYDNRSIDIGLGLTGKVSGPLSVGAQLNHVDDRSVYRQSLDVLAGADSAALLAATGGLPDVVFRQTVLKLFARYALDKKSSLRLDLLVQRSQWTDWAWGSNGVPFTYADGSTLRQNPRQRLGALGVTYTWQWR